MIGPLTSPPRRLTEVPTLPPVPVAGRAARRTDPSVVHHIRERAPAIADPATPTAPSPARGCCLHCILERLVRKEAVRVVSADTRLVLAPVHRILLPMSAHAVYRDLRRFIREATQREDGHLVRVAVIDMVGKSHVEVSVGVREGARRGRVRCYPLPRHVEGTLEHGFAEGTYD